MPDDIHTNFSIEGSVSAPAETPVTDDDDELPPPPLWKQAVGAVAGSLIALALYTVYEAAAPVVTAWVFPREERHAATDHEEHVAPAKKVSTSTRQKRQP